MNCYKIKASDFVGSQFFWLLLCIDSCAHLFGICKVLFNSSFLEKQKNSLQTITLAL